MARSDIAAFLLPVGIDPLGSSGSTRFPDIPEALDVISVNRLGKQPERTVSFSGLDGNMFEHDWVKSPDGKELLDAITEAGKSKSTRGTTRVENSSAQRPNLPDWLRGRRELYETVVERYDGTELDTRIEEAQRESDAIDRAGDGDTPSSPDFFQPVNDVNPHETPVTSHTLDSS
jgi:hypothetical protein